MKSTPHFSSPRTSFRPWLLAIALCPVLTYAAPLTITLAPPVAPITEGFHLGTAAAPNGTTLTVDSQSLRLGKEAWTPPMGEFHYTRYPANEWRQELLKMKAGGIQVIATYVFWIHHEEIEGHWDWSGRRNLREFVRLCGEVGLKAVVRCGPWCHGEVRNGGIPEWLATNKEIHVRSLDPAFLQRTRELYAQIAKQLDGLLWKSGGPVIGIQMDNEYPGPAEYLLELKKIAREVGLDTPIYTRTGWPALKTPMPFGEIVPLFGAYPEGFWDRETTSMPGKYWAHAFRFSPQRTDENIANEQLGRSDREDTSDVAQYPYLTCELGGGMMNSYHRRILIHPEDIDATALVKLGSGSTLLGYYMYHGGTNPDGQRTPLMEAQDTPMTNWNDLPVKNYDFQAPLGEYGQIRPHYHLLRRLHLFLGDFAASVASTSLSMPDVLPRGHKDDATLLWSARSDGRTGYVFVNNYERSREMPAKPDIQFAVTLSDKSTVVFPEKPVSVPANSRFFWPFNFDLGHGVRARYATAQPLCVIDEGNTRTVFFAETTGVPTVFHLEGEAAARELRPGLAPAIEVKAPDGTLVRVVLLDEATSLQLYKAAWYGKDRVFLTRAGFTVAGNTARLQSPDTADLHVLVYPGRERSRPMDAKDGIFTRFTPKAPNTTHPTVKAELVQKAGPVREIPLGKISQPVAVEPTDADFASAAVWKITVPREVDLGTDPLLRVHYVGDVARATVKGKLITDDFYNGNVWEIGLRRHAPDILGDEFRIAILPLQKGAVTGPKPKIFMADVAKPDFGDKDAMAEIRSIEIVPQYKVEIRDL